MLVGRGDKFCTRITRRARDLESCNLVSSFFIPGKGGQNCSLVVIFTAMLD